MLLGENEQKQIQPSTYYVLFFSHKSAREDSQLSSTSQPFLIGRFIFGGKGSQSSLILRVGFSRTQSRLKNKCTYLPSLKTQNTSPHMQLLHKRLHHFLIGAFRIGYTHKKKSKQNSNMCTDCAFGSKIEQSQAPLIYEVNRKKMSLNSSNYNLYSFQKVEQLQSTNLVDQRFFL